MWLISKLQHAKGGTTTTTPPSICGKIFLSDAAHSYIAVRVTTESVSAGNFRHDVVRGAWIGDPMRRGVVKPAI